MSTCVFCQIAQGTIPCFRIEEGKGFLTFLDISPVNKGHCLIIPKLHYETLAGIPDSEIGMLLAAAKRAAKAMMASLGAEGYNILMSNHKAGGQVVMHAHIHVIPRFSGDGLSLWQGRPYQEGEAASILSRITEAIRNI